MKKYLGLIVCAMVIVSLAQNVNASSCFDYYHFQSVQVSVGPEKQTFTPGETVNFVGNIINQNSYPVVDGYVFVRIGEKNPKYVIEGHKTVDEFVALGPVAIDASSSIPVSFSWVVPKSLAGGDYKADYFFSVGKKFNLGGLPFTNEIIIGSSEFSVKSSQKDIVSFNRSATKVDNEKYLYVGNWPSVQGGSKPVVTQVLVNSTKLSQKVSVSYELYWWDSLNPSDKIASSQETVTLKASESKSLSYKLPATKESVYYLKTTVTAANGQKSVSNVRILTNGVARARSNYLAITHFPMTKGDTATLFSCYHNTSDSSIADGKVVVELKDVAGNSVAKAEYTGEISSTMSVATKQFTALTDLKYLTLSEKIFDKSGALVESYNSVYDCSVLKSAACQPPSMEVNWIVVGLIASLCILILLIAYILHRRDPNPNHKHLWPTAIILLLILAVVIGIAYAGRAVMAETVSADGKVKTETVSSPYYIVGDENGPAAQGSVSYVHTATLIGSKTPAVGDTISFSLTGEGVYNGTGGSWDTPFLGSKMAVFAPRIYNDGHWDLRYSAFQYTLSNSSTSASLISLNPSILSCSGMTCTAVGVGTTEVVMQISPVTITGTGNHCFYENADTYSKGCYVYEDMIRRHPTAYGTSYFSQTYPSNYDYNGIFVYKSTPMPASFTTSVQLPGYAPRWTIAVTASTILPQAPTNLAVSPATSCGQGVNLSWTASTGAAGYKIYRGGTFLVGTTNTSYNYVTSSSGQYYVTAYNANGESSPSATVTGTPAAACPVIPGGDGGTGTTTPPGGGGVVIPNGGGTAQVSTTTLYIGQTVTSTSTSFMVPLGNAFSLNWIIPSGYGECRVNTTPSASWTATWGNVVSAENNPTGNMGDIPTSNDGIGTYTLSMSCSNEDHTATSTDTVRLRITQSALIEI